MLPSIIDPRQLDAMIGLVWRLPPGDFAEVGVYKGGSAWRLYEVTQRQNRTLHLFDTFSGTPNHVEGLDKHKIDTEFHPGTTAVAELGAKMPRAKLYVGEYPKTHPANLPALAFVHCDCDQYISYIAVIQRLWPLLVPGGILLFDDYPYLAGAKRAVEENFAVDTLKRCLGRYYVVKGEALG